MESESRKYEDWSLDGGGSGGNHGRDKEDDHAKAGVPADIDMIVQGHETEDFWLPLHPTDSAPQITMTRRTTSKPSSAMHAPLHRATSVRHQDSYILSHEGSFAPTHGTAPNIVLHNQGHSFLTQSTSTLQLLLQRHMPTHPTHPSGNVSHCRQSK
jgi:hypothetical protein